MTSHSNFVWKFMMPKCPASSYTLIAHSAGGLCVQHLWANHREELT